MNSTLSISIVTYNSSHIIKEALTSIIQYLPANVSTSIILIDNHSKDNTKQILRDYAMSYKNITLIQNPANIGFAKAHNLAISYEDSRYHVICNPDIILENDVFTPLIRFMDQNIDIGIACPRYQFQNGELQPLNRRYPSIFDFFLRRFLPEKLKPLFQARLDSYVMLDIGYDSSYDVPFVSGAFMFCRSEVLKKVKGFDERYFLYLEDADLSRKVQQHGYRTVYYPYAVLTHVWERSAHKDWRVGMVFIHSAIKYFNKWGYKIY